jgi:biotin transport system substrate-specific component
MKTSSLRSAYTALFAALISAGSLFAIPIGPVPIVLQNAFAVLAGLVLGPLQGAGAVGLFLIAGFLGLPVFSGGKGGMAVILGPTGGYLAGYFIAAMVAGFSMKKAEGESGTVHPGRIVSACISAFLCIYIPGVLILSRKLGISIPMAIAKGFAPFIIGDAIKIAILVPVAAKIRPIVARSLQTNDEA